MPICTIPVNYRLPMYSGLVFYHMHACLLRKPSLLCLVLPVASLRTYLVYLPIYMAIARHRRLKSRHA